MADGIQLGYRDGSGHRISQGIIRTQAGGIGYTGKYDRIVAPAYRDRRSHAETGSIGGDPDVDVVVVIARVLPGGGENRVAIK